MRQREAALALHRKIQEQKDLAERDLPKYVKIVEKQLKKAIKRLESTIHYVYTPHLGGYDVYWTELGRLIELAFKYRGFKDVQSGYSKLENMFYVYIYFNTFD